MQSAPPRPSPQASTHMVLRGGVPFTPAVAPFVSRMELVDEYRQTLLRLQGAWDVLALLGQMSGTGAEISRTRTGFQRLTETLLDSLATQLLEQRLNGLRGKAQVAIDILVRNLFERTADVGFLATDEVLRAFVAAAGDGSNCEAQRSELQARFAAYVAKYSVYDDIAVLAPDGRVLARLDDSVALDRSRDPLVAAAQRSGTPFVESFGECDLLGGRRGLLYSAAIAGADGRPAGVLCLSFRFENELGRIFKRLLDGDDSTVLALLDAKGDVIQSADRWQIPTAAPLPDAVPNQPLLRFAGREYLRVGARSAGYQGYAGPGWQAQALLPVDFAFRVDPKDAAARTNDHTALARDLDTRDIFSAGLRSIPLQAQQIQRDLARSVWNGRLMRSDHAAASARPAEFASAFLHEVSSTGAQIRTVFEDAISRLQTGAITAILDEARFQASLAIDIMDRNLYERANDCRWWALTPVLRQALAGPDAAMAVRAGEVLRHINGLYTVYTLLVLFDAQGAIVAVSDPARGELIGQALDANLVRATLALRDPQHHAVSEHAPSALYGGRPTYVYAAAVQAEGPLAAPGGGVAIVFDGAPQFEAMLQDALPRDARGQTLHGAFGLFVTRSGQVVASTDARFQPGSMASFAERLADLPAMARGATGQRIVEIDGVLHAIGIAHGSGYREYRCGTETSAQDVAAIVLMRLGVALAQSSRAAPLLFEPMEGTPAKAGSTLQEIAGFTVDGDWFGLEASEVEEVLGQLQIASIPNAPPHVAGLLRTHDRIVPVLDLAAMLREGATAAADGPLLLCRTAAGQRFALRVDTLGTVFEVDAQRLKPWQPNAATPAVKLLSGRMGTQEAMLTVLRADTLWQSVGDAGALLGLQVEAPPRAATASVIEIDEAKQFA